MKNYTLSLSRWHKVAERLSRAYLGLTQSARNIFTNTQVSGFLGEAQITRLRVVSERGLAELERAFVIQDAISTIRRMIGEANARVGVAPLLASYDALVRRQKLLEGILGAQSCEMISFEEVAYLPNQIVGEDRYDRQRNLVSVRTLEPEAQALLEAKSAELLGQIYALADQISDLNRERVSIDLPEEVALAGGL